MSYALFGKPVQVEWVDAATYRGWTKASVAEGTSLACRAVGILVVDQVDRIVLATSVSAGDLNKLSNDETNINFEACCCLVIPRECVKSIRRLK